jgi:hypothetical protein
MVRALTPNHQFLQVLLAFEEKRRPQSFTKLLIERCCYLAILGQKGDCNFIFWVFNWHVSSLNDSSHQKRNNTGKFDLALRYRCAPAYGSKEEIHFICLLTTKGAKPEDYLSA